MTNAVKIIQTMNGCVYIFLFLDRIYRIYWIVFHQFLPEIDEKKYPDNPLNPV